MANKVFSNLIISAPALHFVEKIRAIIKIASLTCITQPSNMVNLNEERKGWAQKRDTGVRCPRILLRSETEAKLFEAK